jgi:hypothetical protein
MSWFKEAFEKVKEKGAAVKGIAKEVTHRAKEVRSRLIGTSSAMELQVQLENRAGAVSTLLEMADVVRGWTGNVVADDKGPRFADGIEKQLTFAQVLLRSQAIEELLACIVCQPNLRMELYGAWPSALEMSGEEDSGIHWTDGQLGAVHLFNFLKRTLTGNEAIWHEIVSIILAPHGDDTNELQLDEEVVGSTDWLTRCERNNYRFLELSVLSKLKKDWYADWLEKERRELAASVDAKRNDIVQNGDQLWQRIKLSSELVDLYESVKDNLDDSTVNRASRMKEVVKALSATQSEAGKTISSAQTEKENSHQRQQVVKANLANLELEFKPRLEAILEERTAIEFKLAALEDRKHQLKLELERVSQELAEVQTAQRDAMTYETQVRNELAANRRKFNEMLNKETNDEGACQTNQELHSRISVLIRSLQESTETEFLKTSSSLAEVYTNVDSAFLEAVQDHLSILAESIQDLYRKCKRLVDELESVKRTKNAQSMSSMFHESPEKEEFSASTERLDVRINELSARLRLEADDVIQFESNFKEFFSRFESKITSNRLLGGEVEKINFVFGETQKILSKYNMGKSAVAIPSPKKADILVEEIPESPREVERPAQGTS